MKIDKSKLTKVEIPLSPQEIADSLKKPGKRKKGVNKQKPVKSKSNYMKYRKEHVLCEIPSCRTLAVDCHHIIFKSQGGSDVPENFIALCRAHHEEAHGPESRQVRERLINFKSSQ